MTEFQDIKNRIYIEQRIEEVLEYLECWAIETEQKGDLFVAGLPDGDNKRSVQVKNNESLNANIRSKGVDGDIFAIISYVLYDADTKEKRSATLHKSKYWLCTKLNYQDFIDDFYKETSDRPLEIKQNQWLKGLQRKRQQSSLELTNKIYSPTLLEQFDIVPYKKWVDEGISSTTQKEFGVGIDVKSERITFPVHNKSGELIGVKGRYCGRNNEIESAYKYLYLLPCNKSIEFFNFHRATPHIKEKQEVIIVEGGKSTMLLHQWGYKNCISIEGDKISDHQVTLLKGLGRNIRYLFAFDKDKDAEFVVNETTRLAGRIKYGIYDTDNLLEKKDSPIDKGEKVWKKLYLSNRYKIN